MLHLNSTFQKNFDLYLTGFPETKYVQSDGENSYYLE